MSSPKDEAAVRALYQELMAGWNKGSGESFAATFAEDGDLIGFDGTQADMKSSPSISRCSRSGLRARASWER